MSRFCLLRILGNDLPPLHSESQSLENLKFILEEEPELVDCDKIWLLNRIADSDKADALNCMLREANMKVLYSAFDPVAYCRCQTFAEKIQYVTNNNSARNTALIEGGKFSRVVLPFDGQLFFTGESWQRLVRDVDAAGSNGIFYVPMYRLKNNALLLSYPDSYLRKGVIASEPQVMFTRDNIEWFNPAIPYGNGPKVELLLRLGVPGPWDHWSHPYFVQLRARVAHRRSRHYGGVVSAGHVFRLAPGNSRTVGDIVIRNQERQEGIKNLLTSLDARFLLDDLH